MHQTSSTIAERPGPLWPAPGIRRRGKSLDVLYLCRQSTGLRLQVLIDHRPQSSVTIYHILPPNFGKLYNNQRISTWVPYGALIHLNPLWNCWDHAASSIFYAGKQRVKAQCLNPEPLDHAAKQISDSRP